jgi:hypothetical protein
MRVSKVAMAGVRASVGAILAAVLMATTAGLARAQLTGTVTVPSASYPTLADAINDLNAQGVGAGGVTIDLVAGNPQTAPAGGYAINLATNNATAANPIVLRGNGNTITASAALTAGALNDAIFKIIGEDHVTIENFVMQENAANTTTTAASNNMTEWGVALLYRTPTDNAQNVTIRNNQITLNRTYQNTFGIYANATHSATAPTTSATATGPNGGNSGLVLHNNAVSNVNVGIVVIGPTAAADHNTTVEIGGSSTTGNTIANYGTTGTFSSYANVSGTVNGILVRNTRDYTISHNTITSSVGGVTSGTLRGIFVVAASAAPTGTLTQVIRNNQVSVRSGVAGGAVLGIAVESGTSTATSSVEIRDNTIANSGWTLAATAAFTGISLAGSGTAGPLATTINGNVFDNLSLSTSGNVTLIANSFTRPANGTITVNGNRIQTALAKTVGGGTVRCYDNFGISPATVTEVNDGNDLSNITLSGGGATALECWRSADGTTPGSRKTVTNNVFANLVNSGTGATTALLVSFSDETFAGNTVAGNVVRNVSNTNASSTGAVIGISTTAQSQNVVGNTVHSLSAAGTGAVTGISVSGGVNQVVARNRIYDLENTNAGGFVNGILVSAGTTVNVQNNLIGDLRTPAANAANPLVGINVTGGTTVNVDYNTVNLNATSTGALFGSSALSASTTPTLTLRNNNLVNTSTSNGTGVSVAYRRSTTTLTSYGAASNANNLFAPSLYNDGTNNDTTLAAYKARVAPRDAASVSENPPWQSTVGANPNFLNISTTVPTQLESGGLPVAGITTDVVGNPRNATAPDIGAWEFNGIPLDVTPPVITYTPFGNTTLTTNRTLAATITDAGGVAGGVNAPRVYFRKGTSGPYVSTACTGSAPSYACTIDHALIGGVAAGDTVQYFVVAQDTAGNVGANPSAGFAATDVNNVTSPPTTPSAYLIVAPFPASVNVGTSEAFTSLTNPGGLFEALNNGVLGSNVVATITTDLTAETGAIALNQLLEEGPGAGTYTVTIRPAGARTVSGAPTARLIDLNGADRVTIDGLNSGGNSLLIRNEGAGETVRFTNDASSNRLLNTVIEGAGGVTAVAVAAGTVTGNDDILIANNIVRDRTVPSAAVPFNAIGSTATSTSIVNDNLVIRDNEVVNFVQAGVFINVGTAGFTVRDNLIRRTLVSTNAVQIAVGVNGFQGGANTIRSNTIRDLESTATAAGRLSGIELITATGGTISVSDNRIENLRYTGTANVGVFGIRSGIGTGGSTAQTTIAGNTLLGFTSNTTNTSAQVTGIDLATHTVGVVAERNRISGLAHTAAAAVQIRGILIGNTQPAATVRENRIFGFAPGATATGAISGIFFAGASGQPASATLVNNYISIAPTATTGQQIFGIFDFGFATNVLRADFNSVFIGGTASGSSSTWAFRRGDGTPTGVTLRNNILYNARSGGTGNHYAVGDQSVNTGSWTSNHNLFVGRGATVGNHFDLGTAAAGTPVNFAIWQAGPPTRDANSTSFDAGAITLANYFVDAPAGNLDLLATATGAVDAGVAIPGITTDINGTTRLDPPEIGAFELAVGILTISPTTVDFGSVPVSATSAPETVTLANVGNAPLTVNPLTAPSAPFAVAGGSCGAPPITIPNGGSCTLVYTFTPTAPGPATQTLTVTSSGLGSGTITLQGNGVTVDFQVAPNPAAFGNQLVGTTSAPLTVTLTNNGSASVTVTGLPNPSAPFARSGGTCPATPFPLAPSASCTVEYTFSPTVVGPASGSVAIATSVGTTTLSLTGTGIQGNLVISPTSLAFGSVAVGGTSAAQTVTLSNTGTAALDVTALTAATPPFARTGGTCPVTLPFTLTVGGSCTLAYTFSPTVVGPASQTLNVTATAPGSGTITLSGTGTPSADLSIVKSSAVNLIQLGLIQYTLVVSNAGPSAVTGAVVTDTFPTVLSNVLWSCVGIGGGSCAANGTGNISELVDLPVGASVVFAITANVTLPLPNAIANTATVAPPTGVTDPVAGNNSSTVNDVSLIFADGFEALPPLVMLEPTAPGESRSVLVPAEQLAAAALGPVAQDAVRYAVAGASLTVQARRIGERVEARLLVVDEAGEWKIGEWVSLGASRGLLLEWATGASVGGRTPIQARLRSGN